MTELAKGEMWCSACGSIVNDGQCDCTRMETGPGNHVLLRDYLTDEITRLREELDAAEAELVCLDSRVARLRTQRDQLLAALKFYADEENWREEGSFLHLGSQVRADEGEIARAALAAVEDTA